MNAIVTQLAVPANILYYMATTRISCQGP